MLKHLLEAYPGQVSLAEKDNNGRTTILLAAENGRVQMLEHLLKTYPDQVSLAEKDYKGRTALFLAAENRQIEMLKYLLESYPDQVSLAEKNKDGDTLLFWLVKNDRTIMLDYLLKNYPEQTSLTEKDPDGNTPLFWAVKNGKTEILDFLLENYPQQISLIAQPGLNRIESERKELNQEATPMSTEKMRLFSEVIAALISKIEEKEIEKSELQRGIEIIRAQLKKANSARKVILNNTIPFLKTVAQYYKEGELAESKRDEYFQKSKNNLIPLNDRIQEYKETIQLFLQNIHKLNNKIQEIGESIYVIMAEYNIEARKLSEKSAKHIFSYTRLNPSLFKMFSVPDGTKPIITIEEACNQYFTTHKIGPP